MPPATQTALVVPVPAAGPVVDRHRRHLDAAAAWGVPAHVTVTYPFVAPGTVDAAVLAAVAAAVREVPAFDARFARTRWFGDDVLWLDPEPAGPFRALTAAVLRAFPEHPPYGGAHADVVPHLTVAERRLGDLPALLAAERDVQARLPCATRVDRVQLLAGAEAVGSWRVLHELPLG